MIPWLGPDDPFPPVERSLAHPSGLLAASRHIDAGTLLLAYSQGIFPWYAEDDPVLWWSPDPRMVLFTREFVARRSLVRRIRAGLNAGRFEVLVDADFETTMRACAAPRGGREGTWITEEMLGAYCELHERGLAHSVEVVAGGRRIGGLYGVAIGRMVFGESMFSLAPDASKIALAALIQLLRLENVPMLDCQQETSHLASLGARPIARAQFCLHVAAAVRQPPIDWARYRERAVTDLLRAY
jgi:leucyl/phenylalanyl-tRNA---protein transferase